MKCDTADLEVLTEIIQEMRAALDDIKTLLTKILVALQEDHNGILDD